MSTRVPWSLVKGGFHKTPHFESLTQKTAAVRGTSTLALMPYPSWDFSVDLDMVSGGESQVGTILQLFLECFMATCGGGNYFLFTDPNDNTVSNGVMLNVTPAAASPMGQVGDGTSTVFMLARLIGQSPDVLQNVSGVAIKVGGVAKALGTDYTISSTGVVTFVTAPANNATITWTGSFQYLCKFTEDTLKDLARVSKNIDGFLWACSSIEFESQILP